MGARINHICYCVSHCSFEFPACTIWLQLVCGAGHLITLGSVQVWLRLQYMSVCRSSCVSRATGEPLVNCTVTGCISIESIDQGVTMSREATNSITDKHVYFIVDILKFGCRHWAHNI